MNHMEEVAKMLGTELWKEFKLKGVGTHTYKLTEETMLSYINDLKSKEWYPAPMVLLDLINGISEIEWQPKEGDIVYNTYATFEKPIKGMYGRNNYIDKLMLKRGLIKPTYDEALEKMKELGWL